jgi:hypothetical protein
MPDRWFSLFLLLAFFGWVFWRVAASRVLFTLVVRHGKIVKAKGRAPGELLHDVEDIFGRARCSGRATVRIRSGRAEVDAPALPNNVVQQLRNVIGRFPLPRLRTAPEIRS